MYSTVRRLRVYSGVILFVYVLSHFINHSLGIVSIELMNAGCEYFIYVWRSFPGAYALYGAILLHVLCGIYAVVTRNTFKLRIIDLIQIVSGATMPLFLFFHLS